MLKEGEKKEEPRRFQAVQFTSVLYMTMGLILLEILLWHIVNKKVIGESQQGVTKGKSKGPTNFVAFTDGVAALVDEGRATDVISGLCKTFGTSLSINWIGVSLMDGTLTG